MLLGRGRLGSNVVNNGMHPDVHNLRDARLELMEDSRLSDAIDERAGPCAGYGEMKA